MAKSVEVVTKLQCTGCQMCGDLCPKDAITYQTDHDGFWYPAVDHEKCVDCGLCQEKCPALQVVKSKKQKEPTVYAAWSLDDEVRYDSTSGGIYYEIAKAFIQEGGYIAGCVFAEDYKSAKHIVGNTMEDLRQIMGSKYFQSDAKGVYQQVKKLLSAGNEVLFCGTPCQVAALTSYIGDDDRNLYLLDFICKGINSPKAYRAYIEELEQKYHSPVCVVRQKSKKTGWQSLATNVRFKNGKEYHKDRYTDWWIQGYTCGNLFMRQSCQNCQYKGMPRQADLTFGDFWGIRKCSDDDMYKGVSVVFKNSDKGNYLLELSAQRIHLEQRNMEEVVEGNPYLFGQATQRGDREKFFELVDTTGFSKAVKRAYTETVPQRLKRYSKLILKRVFKRKKW